MVSHSVGGRPHMAECHTDNQASAELVPGYQTSHRNAHASKHTSALGAEMRGVGSPVVMAGEEAERAWGYCMRAARPSRLCPTCRGSLFGSVPAASSCRKRLGSVRVTASCRCVTLQSSRKPSGSLMLVPCSGACAGGTGSTAQHSTLWHKQSASC